MKTKNLILIVALIAFATVSYSQSTAERTNIPVTVKISLKQALLNPELVRILHEQIKPDFAPSAGTAKYYTVVVYYHGIRYAIFGTFEEWKLFFNTHSGTPITNL
jgi:hypothetical protein